MICFLWKMRSWQKIKTSTLCLRIYLRPLATTFSLVMLLENRHNTPWFKTISQFNLVRIKDYLRGCGSLFILCQNSKSQHPTFVLQKRQFIIKMTQKNSRWQEYKNSDVKNSQLKLVLNQFGGIVEESTKFNVIFEAYSTLKP